MKLNKSLLKFVYMKLNKVSHKFINLKMLKNIIFRTLTYRQNNKSLKYFPNISKSVDKQLHYGQCLRKPRVPPKPVNQPSPAITSKYQVITETNSSIIEHTADEVYIDEKYPILSDEFDGINLERGKNGVFEIEDLVDLLQRENSKNIFVAAVSKDINYVEYICVASARSKRHLLALAEFVRKVYKKKCHKNDYIPRIEGKKSDEWMALDLGNIALHIFSDKTRNVYDLETLWAVGPEYDEKANNKSEVVDMLENYSSYLKDLKPLE